MKEAETRYVSRTPRKVPEGRIVVHNHVRSTNEDGSFRSPGIEGFRVWTERANTLNRAVCRCGWAPHLKEHYRVDLKGFDLG
jgi:hypothetical protein